MREFLITRVNPNTGMLYSEIAVTNEDPNSFSQSITRDKTIKFVEELTSFHHKPDTFLLNDAR